VPWHFSESVRSAGPESPRSTQTPRSSPLFIARQLRVDIRFSARGSVLPRGESIRADGPPACVVFAWTITGKRDVIYHFWRRTTSTVLPVLYIYKNRNFILIRRRIRRRPQTTSHMACVENLVVWTHSFGDIRANRQKRPSLTQFPFLGGVLITSEQL